MLIEEISKPVKRMDVAEKISGTTQYLADMDFQDALYAKTLRSTKPRARIVSIDLPDIPDNYYIVDKSDVPGRNKVRIIIYDQPFFAEDVVNYIGEPILLIVGPEKEKVEEIVSKIKVNYEELKAVFTMEEAEQCKELIYGKDNCFADYKYSKGDIEAAKAKAAHVFEREYKTGYQEHIYLESQGMVGSFENGRVKVIGSMQCPYYVKDAVVEALGFDESKVQIIQSNTGGGFGGKEEYPSLLGGQVAVAALKTEKTVKLIFDRDEDIQCTTKRHPSHIKLRTYLDKDNKIIGVEADVKFDAGAYSGITNIVLQRSIFAAVGVYDVENVKVRGRAFATNNIVSGAYRGFGAPQSFFAVEMHMEYIAKQLNINPLEFRKKNLLKKGDYSSTGGIFREDILLPEIIDTIDKMSDYSKKYEQYKNENSFKGIGLSVFFHGGGFTGDGERDIIKAKVKLRKYNNSSVEILISNVEMGQGVTTGLRKIVAHALCIPIENIIYTNPDTDRVPNSGPTVASRTTMIVGKLLQDAAIEMKNNWDSSDEFEVTKDYKHPEGFSWDAQNFVGDAYNTYSWGANVVEVEVNPITYEVDVKGVWAVYDIGNAIDEKIIEGQIEGGVVQGLGFAGMEVMNSKNGQLLQRTNTDYVIPTAKDFPKTYSKLVNSPYNYGPFGAKSAGELTLVGSPSAYAIAVQNAIGRTLNQIPVTPETIMEVMEDESRN
ncbi:xanthine dehydrogenase family protein molybdopterin-binding subunit [Clostridium sp. DJ247]|uniref:xanthine dehydrogenase family protein molybdopterin-binding subunit n=1 Tax=Clostridium sp. DJ247 TaxID=2726188 RepID=UPI001625067E|nr:xanthine dehydrogenase family protein molybdopterin-binding subunit [Clostridium sp. DJ247]MBC2580379.1 xanthine dehydrogenase family protein [Clostridium sp. DJ247]